MQNVTMSWEKETLVIRVDTTKTFGPSKSGKTTIIASTQGNEKISSPAGNKVTVGVNVYK